MGSFNHARTDSLQKYVEKSAQAILSTSGVEEDRKVKNKKSHFVEVAVYRSSWLL